MQSILRQVVLLVLLLSAVPAFAAGGRWSTLGPDGGTVFALAVDPGDPRIVYAGTRGGGGVFKSYDAGETWEPASSGLPRDLGGHVTALAVDPIRRTTLWAGTRGFGVWKSTDGGASWSRSLLPAVFEAKNVFSLAVDPRTPDVVYAGTGDGLFKTTNGGATWAAKVTGLPAPVYVAALAIDPSRTNIVYAGHLFDGIFKSTDSGESWAESDRGIAENSGATALEVHPRQPATVFAGTLRGVSRSTDRGANWTSANFLTEQEDRVLDLAVHPGNPRIVFAGTALTGAWRSDDGGAHWIPINSGLTSPQVRALAADPAGAALYAGTEGEINRGGVFKSADGRTWRRTVEGLKAAGVSSVAVEPDGTLWAASGSVGGPLGLYRSGDGGRTWILTPPHPDATRAAVAADPVRPGTVYAQVTLEREGTFTPALFRTTDSGRTWTRLPDPPAFARTMEIDPRGILVFYEDGVLISRDGGATWTRSAGEINDFGTVADVAVDPVSPNILYAVANVPGGRFSPAEGRAYKSTDGGVTWTRIGAQATVFALVGIVVHPTNPSLVYTASPERVYRSRDAGATWEAISQELQEEVITDLLIGPDGVLYAGTAKAGVFASPDGVSWSSVGTGLAALDVSFLQFDPNDPDTLYAGTSFSGLQAFTIPKASVCVPSETALCLLGNRFRVEATWRDFDGNAGTAKAVPQTGDTGAFWFFHRENLELMVKVIDGRGVNGRFWFYYGSLSNVAFTITVTDTATGLQKTYRNPSGRF
ncbi:MAG TPA: hypothetical protein VLE27_03515, partial [Thermoanaerobaculia bacterium]|nr:hypothetical protein [Thermoanaerobaculia bacterium]